MPNYFTITSPQLRIDRRIVHRYAEMIEVQPSSPPKLRKPVLTIATYFRREFRYDFLQFGLEDEDDYRAFLFLHNDGCAPECLAVIGACCFRWREWSNRDAGWAMQWIWFHPYFRGRGKLTAVWPKFKEQFGDFHVERPLSSAMECFLTKMNEF